MAKLPDPVVSNIFIIQRRIIECLDSTTATEFRLFERMGETAETLLELEELQNIKEKLRSKYSRLYNLLLRIAESQPIASEDMLVLLYRLPPVRFANDRVNRSFYRCQHCQSARDST
jgi:hypothetical protein